MLNPQQIALLHKIAIGAISVNYVALYITAINLHRELKKQQRRYVKLHEGAAYLADIIEKHEIPLTEFDAIVLKTIIEEHNASQ